MNKKVKLRSIEIVSIIAIVIQVILIGLFIIALTSGRTITAEIVLEWVLNLLIFTLINIYLLKLIKKLQLEINKLENESN